MDNIFIKLIVSIPVILIVLYFIPFLGICLLIFRLFVINRRNTKKNTAFYLIGVSIILLIPKILDLVSKYTSLEIPYIKQIIDSSLYSVNILKYAKLLFIIGVVYFILYTIFNKIFDNVFKYMNGYVKAEQDKSYQISKENDLIMQEKREKAKNTHAFKCRNCGASFILSSNTGTCPYCRSSIEYKD